MSNRERWIIYPLLFYSMAMGFKANYLSPLEFRCQSIACRKLSVTEAIDTNALHVRVVNGVPPALDWSALMRAAANAMQTEPSEATEETPEEQSTETVEGDSAAIEQTEAASQE